MRIISSEFMKIKGDLIIICEKNTPAYPLNSNIKIVTSAKNAEHKNGISLFQNPKISS